MVEAKRGNQQYTANEALPVIDALTQVCQPLGFHWSQARSITDGLICKGAITPQWIPFRGSRQQRALTLEHRSIIRIAILYSMSKPYQPTGHWWLGLTDHLKSNG